MQLRICSFCSRQNRVQALYCGNCGRLLHTTLGANNASSHTVLTSGTFLGAQQRYQIHSLIGSGGFSQAYLAHDMHHWQRACLIKRLAIKTDTPPTLIPLISANFEREARLLVALGHPGHQNIPDMYEYLSDERCLVMKYITGESFERVLKRKIGPLLEEEALRYIRDACAALKYMHEHQLGPILHRDLKPSNIMLDETGRVFLIDFGLAHDQSLSHAIPDWGGTYGYMPPEQDRGQPEPRSDIYALGASCYELVTGKRPPHLSKGLLPPRQLNPELRPELEQLIMRCMAADVSERPQATELLGILDDLLESANIPAPPASIPLPSQPFTIGRHAELQMLEKCLHNKRFVALLGMAGVGKTALALTLAHRHMPAELVFWHRFHAGESANLAITQLAGWLAQRGYPAIWRQIHHHRQSGLSEMPVLEVEYLAQSAGLQGSLLCFDDVHTVANDPILQHLLDSLRNAAATGPMVMITTRTLPSFVAPADSVHVQGLEAACIPALLAQHGLHLEQAEREQLWHVTEGNPQFLMLAIYAMQQAADPHSLLNRLSETELIEHYLLHEVDEHLSHDERLVMSALSILLGHSGERSMIEELLDGVAVRRELAALVNHQLLSVEQHETGAVYYQHAIVQSFYYHLQGVRQRQQLHRHAAAYYERHGRDRVSAARHYAHAGDEQRAASLLSTAPWQLFNRGQAHAVDEVAASLSLDTLTPQNRAALLTAHSEAAELLGKDEQARILVEQALDIETDEPPVRRARRYRLLARIYARRNEHERAEVYCYRGLELAALPDTSRRRTETARLYAQLAEILMRRGKVAKAMEACASGLEALPAEPATPIERTILLQRLATMAGEAGDYDQAIEVLEQSLGVARQAGDLALTARVLHNLGLFYTYSGASKKALPHLHESITLKERLGDRSSTIDTLNVLGMVYMAHGDQTSALHYFQVGYDMAESYKLPASMAHCLHNIGQLAYDRGNYETARDKFLGASILFQRAGEMSGVPQCLSMLAEIALAVDDTEAAYVYAQQALEISRQIGRQPLEACALRVLGDVQLAYGDLNSAADVLAQAQVLTEAVGDPYDIALILGVQARLALASGRHDDALRDGQHSLELAREHHIGYLEKAMNALLTKLNAQC